MESGVICTSSGKIRGNEKTVLRASSPLKKRFKKKKKGQAESDDSCHLSEDGGQTKQRVTRHVFIFSDLAA